MCYVNGACNSTFPKKRCFPEKILGCVLCMFLQILWTDWRFEGWYWKICAPEKSSCPFSALCWKSQLHPLVILDWVLELWHPTLDLSHTLTIIRVVKNWFGWRKLTYHAYISILSMFSSFWHFSCQKVQIWHLYNWFGRTKLANHAYISIFGLAVLHGLPVSWLWTIFPMISTRTQKKLMFPPVLSNSERSNFEFCVF